MDKVYSNIGILESIDDDLEKFYFDKYELALYLEGTCCDTWDYKILSDEEKYTTFYNKKYKFINIENLIGKDIEHLTISYDIYSTPIDVNIEFDEFGILTLYTKDGYYFRIFYGHEHNGYYPSPFLYYTDIEKPKKEYINKVGRLIDYDFSVSDLGFTNIIKLHFEKYILFIYPYDNNYYFKFSGSSSLHDLIGESYRNNNIEIDIEKNIIYINNDIKLEFLYVEPSYKVSRKIGFYEIYDIKKVEN